MSLALMTIIKSPFLSSPMVFHFFLSVLSVNCYDNFETLICGIILFISTSARVLAINYIFPSEKQYHIVMSERVKDFFHHYNFRFYPFYIWGVEIINELFFVSFLFFHATIFSCCLFCLRLSFSETRIFAEIKFPLSCHLAWIFHIFYPVSESVEGRRFFGAWKMCLRFLRCLVARPFSINFAIFY